MAVGSDAKALVEALTDSGRFSTVVTKKARVISIEGTTAWVAVIGGAPRTPCTMGVSCKANDYVMVTFADTRAIITSNVTSPATDDTEADAARELADVAATEAGRAYSSAQIAEGAATAAERSASEASVSARQAFSYLLDVEDDWAAIDEYREEAGATVAEIAEDAETAKTAANEAKDSAYNANEYAARALGHLGTVESVGETLAWITEHGTMARTADTAPDPTHVYFVADDDGYYTVGTKQVYQLTEDVAIDPDKTYYELVYSYALTQDVAVVQGKTYYVLVEGTYVAVENPVDDDIATYYERSETYDEVETPVVADISTYYELVTVPAKYNLVIEPDPAKMGEYYELSIDKSLQNYVGTHMALDNEGLWLMPEGPSGSRILISTGQNQSYPAGTHIFDGVSGNPIAYYGEETVIGDPLGFHILVTPNVVDGISGLIGF